MINATVLCYNNTVIGFIVKNHGETSVCAAISMLTINTVNSIEKLTSLTENDFTCKWNNSGGFMAFKLNSHRQRDSGAGILLDALALGFISVSKEYPLEITLKKQNQRAKPKGLCIKAICARSAHSQRKRR